MCLPSGLASDRWSSSTSSSLTISRDLHQKHPWGCSSTWVGRIGRRDTSRVSLISSSTSMIGWGSQSRYLEFPSPGITRSRVSNIHFIKANWKLAPLTPSMIGSLVMLLFNEGIGKGKSCEVGISLPSDLC